MKPIVYIVDDDKAIREALQSLLEDAGFTVQAFADGPSFLAACGNDCAGCVVLDLSMPGMNGHEVQNALKERGVHIPLVFLSGQGHIPSAVKAVQGGAVDFLEKPVQGNALLDRVREAMTLDKERRQAQETIRDARRRHARLSPREREVMTLVIAGLSSKEIGQDLGLSPRTVEQHRAHIMYKMGVANITELVNMAANCIDLPWPKSLSK
jgi:two-component system response regulator FixJ